MSLHSVPIHEQVGWLDATDSHQSASPVKYLPNGFAAYLKILTPLGIDPRIPIEAYSFSVASVQAINNRVSFWNKYQIINGRPSTEHLQPISYREVAARIGAEYSSEFDDTAIVKAYSGWPPNLGSSETMEAAFIQLLTEKLGASTPAFFYGSSDEGMYHFSADGTGIEDWLYTGTVADLAAVFHREQDFPSYTFPADNSWCLYHPEDAGWLFLACSEQLAQNIGTADALESFCLI